MIAAFFTLTVISGRHPPRGLPAPVANVGKLVGRGIDVPHFPGSPAFASGFGISYTFGSRDPYSVTPLSISNVTPSRNSSGPVKNAFIDRGCFLVLPLSFKS